MTQPGDKATEPARPRVADPARWRALAVIALSLQVVVIDMTVVHVATPSIAADLLPSAVAQLWIVDVYSLVTAPLLLLATTIADRYGRKRTMLSGLAFFTVASLLAAAAWSPGALIAARGLQGVGGAMLIPPTMAIVRELFPDRDERVRAIGIWSAAMAAGAAAGPLVGGVLIELSSWQTVFLVNGPVFVLVAPLAWRLIPESRAAQPPPWDPASIVLVTLGVLLLAYGIKEGARHGFDGATALGCLAGAVITLAWFARRQLRAPHPTLDLRLFARRPFAVAVAVVFVAMLALVGLDLFFAQYFQLVLGHGPAGSSLRFAPMVLANLVGGLVAHRFVTTLGTRAVLTGGLLISAAALAPMLFSGTADRYLLFGPAFIVLGLAIEVTMVGANDAIFATASEDQAGQASAVEETAYELGGGLAVAVLGSVLAAVYTAQVAVPAGVGAAAQAGTRESLAGAALAAERLPSETGDAVLRAAREAYLQGFHAVLVVAMVLLGLSALLAAMTLAGGRGGERNEGTANA